MSSVERVLFVANRAAGTGHQAALIDELIAKFRGGLDARIDLQTECIDSHAAARCATAAFLREADVPALIVAGGGGGTLRAVIEGICENAEAGSLPSIERVRIGALRMGSGNVLAKQFGVPRDPLSGLDGLLQSVKTGATAPCCIMRCEALQADHRTAIFFAATLGGFGQFGRVPGDLARFHERCPHFHRFAARALGIERLTNVEYGISLLLRSCRGAVNPASLEEIQVRVDSGDAFSLRLLSGALLNFWLSALPFEPGIGVEDAALSLHLIPFERRFDALSLVFAPHRLARKALTFKLTRNTVVELILSDREAAEYFLDEDPHQLHKRIKLMVAGTLAFVPGPDYRGRETAGEHGA